jgi:hypothetical protein
LNTITNWPSFHNLRAASKSSQPLTLNRNPIDEAASLIARRLIALTDIEAPLGLDLPNSPQANARVADDEVKVATVTLTGADRC